MAETDWDKTFREKLKNIWYELIELSNSKIDKQLIDKQLKSIADDFYTTFAENKSPIPVEKNQYFYSKFNSVSFGGSNPFFFAHSAAFLTLSII